MQERSTDRTIIYYTSNKEDRAFEKKIINDMLSKAGDLPIISISQKPMNLGRNICVGEHGHSYINEWRQILEGCKAANTEYVICCESDFLYSPEYFQFKPKGENVYRYDPIWVMWLNSHRWSKFHKKTRSEGAQIVKRKYYIDLLEKFLADYPGWYDESFGNKNPHSPYYKQDFVTFHRKIPCLSIKTFKGEHRRTGILGGPDNIAKELRHWGNVENLRAKFL